MIEFKGKHPRYVGDGVYASFDGYQIWLETETGDGVVHSIAVEPQVLDRVVKYYRDIVESSP